MKFQVWVKETFNESFNALAIEVLLRIVDDYLYYFSQTSSGQNSATSAVLLMAPARALKVQTE